MAVINTFQNQYLGNTQHALGSSYLESKAILNIQEGYKIGATVQLVDLGPFEIINMVNNGPFDQTITLNAESPLESINHTNSNVARKLINHHIYFDDFTNPDTLNRNWDALTSSVWSMANDTLIAEEDGGDVITYRGNQNIADFVMITRLKSNNFNSSAGSAVSILFRGQPDGFIDHDTFSGYELRITGGSTDTIVLYEVDGASSVSLASVSFNPTNDTFFDLMIVVKGSRVDVYTSTATNENTYTPHFSHDLGINYKWMEGAIGLIHRWNSQAGSISTFDRVELIEIGNQYNAEDVLKESMAMGSVFDSNFENELHDLDTFSSSLGSCFVTGSTEGYKQVDSYNTDIGDSIHMFQTTGSTFNNFVFECEMKGHLGLSGERGGILVGTSSRVYFNALRPTDRGTSRDDINTMLWQGPSALSNYENRGDYTKIRNDQWYKLKLVKSNDYLGFYVNGSLNNYIFGLSTLNTNFQDVFVGIGTHAKGGASGIGSTITSFRNLRISKLDDLVDDVQIEPNTSAGSAFQRYLPQGYIANWRTNAVDIFEQGSSRGVFGVSQYIEGSNDIFNNITGKRSSVVRGDNIAISVETDNTRIKRQVDSTRISFIQDRNVQSISDAENLATSKLKRSNRSQHMNNIQISPRVDMEPYDKAEFINPLLGVSKHMLVKSSTRKFNAANASYRHSIQVIDE